MVEPSPAPPQLHAGAHRVIRLDPDSGRGQIVVDHWQRLRDEDSLPAFDALPVLVSLQRYASARAGLDARAGEVGVWVPGEADPEAVRAVVDSVPIIAIEVPKFTDGRHYSLARLLRERYGFGGELRAFGDVLPDQLFYMRRCGYTSFELKAGKSLATGLQTLAVFSVSYQAAADDPRPLYRRR